MTYLLVIAGKNVSQFLKIEHTITLKKPYALMSSLSHAGLITAL